MREFQKNIVKLRQGKGMTQRDLAKALGVSCGTISNYENGQRTPNFEMMEVLADYFNVPMSELIGDSGASHLMKYAEVNMIDKNRELLLDKIKEFDDFQLARLMAYADLINEGK